MAASERQTRAAAAATESSSSGTSSTTKRTTRPRRTGASAATTTPDATRDETKQHFELPSSSSQKQQLSSAVDATPPLHIKSEQRAMQRQKLSSTASTNSRNDQVGSTADSSDIPARIQVRIASPPAAVTTAAHESSHRSTSHTSALLLHNDHGNDDDDMREYEDASEAAAAALRIDAATTGNGDNHTSPTSVTSAPTSPADDSGLTTPNGSDAMALATKRRRLEDPPMFLEKTYEMLEKCAPEIAGWSVPAGDSFVVKKPIEFAEHVIPVYFKHKNFSSFVRQLNFYGFRKVRVDAETAASVDPKEWWEFRHDKFVRGRRDLLREIKRRTIADGRSTIERAEMDELRAEVCALKDQVQQLNKHMMSVMQALVVNSSSSTTSQCASSSSSNANVLKSPIASLSERRYQHHPPPPQQQHPSPPGGPSPHPHLPSMLRHNQTHPHHTLHSMHPTQSSTSTSVPSSARTSMAPLSINTYQQQPRQADGAQRTPATTYQLRPLQSVAPSLHHVPLGATTTTASSHLSPVFTFRSGPGSAPAGMSFVDRVDWGGYHVQQQHHAPPQHSFNPSPRFASSAYASGPDRASVMAMASSASLRRAEAAAQQASSTGFKRTRDGFAHDSSGNPSSAASTMHESPPDAAVRQLSMTATHTRSELLGCIIARILGFIRIQQQQLPPRSSEVDAVADAVLSDIQQLLARIQEPAAPSSPATARSSAHSEAVCMYRVEILKFISRELPRAVHESVEKRLSPQVKKHQLNRSLLALLVQKAQAALEHQMRVETAAPAGPAMLLHSSSSSASPATLPSHRP